MQKTNECKFRTMANGLRKTSSRLKSRRLLVVEVLCAGLELVSLLFLCRASAESNLTQAALMGAVSQNLLAAEVLLLHGPHTLLVLLLLAGHLSFSHLHLALIHDVSPLVSVHTLEMVGFDTMRCKH